MKTIESPNKLVRDELILAQDDAQYVKVIPSPKDYATSLTYTLPQHASDTVSIMSITWSNESTSIRMKPATRSDLKIYSKTSYCTDRWLFFCTERRSSESLARIESSNGSSYDIDARGFGDDEQMSDGGKDYSFRGVPKEALRSFKLVGLNFSVPSVSVESSDEEAADLKMVSSFLDKDEAAINVRKLVWVANKFASNDSLNKMLSTKIRNRLDGLSSIAAYSVVLKELGPGVGALPDVADDFLLLLFRSEVMPKNETGLSAKFIDTYQNASGRVLRVAFDHTVQVEQARIASMLEEEYKARATLFFPLSQEKKDAASESVAKKYYSDTIRAKDAGDMTLFAVRHKALMSTDALKGTSARFSLELDKEMKEFLSTRFSELVNANRQATSELSSQMQRMTSQISQLSTAMDKPVDTNAEWQSNQRFLYQQKVFDEMNNKGKVT